MRRSSVITIILLVIVIIGLSLALILTNLPKEEDKKEVSIEDKIEIEENNDDKEETYKELSLTDSISVDIAKIIEPVHPYAYFYNLKKGYMTGDDIDNKLKLCIAFFNLNKDLKDEDHISKAQIDESMMKVFGNTKYIPENFYFGGVSYEYDSLNQEFNRRVFGGGGTFSTTLTGIYKVEEYSDRYVAYSKYLYTRSTQVLRDENGEYAGEEMWLYSYPSFYDGYYVDRYYDHTDKIIPNNVSLNELIKGIDGDRFVCPYEKDDGYKYEQWTSYSKILNKYFDQASEYKHTFMKNEDGSFYWVKSEIIK